MAEKAKEVKVILLKEHTHKKIVHPKGSEITVREKTADWMRKDGVCK